MFTGIIQSLGEMTKKEKKNSCLYLYFSYPQDWVINLGDSVALNGVCQTVFSLPAAGEAGIEVMPETQVKTTLGTFKPQDKLNLELALKVGDRIGGHFVTGHVDEVGELIKIEKNEQAWILQIKATPDFLKGVAVKGSVTIDGVSLTVMNKSKDNFSVSLVSFTRENTIMQFYQKGQKVNLEKDILARYIQDYFQVNREKSNLDLNFLRQAGF